MENYQIIERKQKGNGHYEVCIATTKEGSVEQWITWERNVFNDNRSGREDWYWGHYFMGEDAEEKARKDFAER